MTNRVSGRYVVFLTLPGDVPTRVGPVEVRWPDAEPVSAEVLGCDFTGVPEFMDRQELYDEMLDGLKVAAALCSCEGRGLDALAQGIFGTGRDCKRCRPLRDLIAKADAAR